MKLIVVTNDQLSICQLSQTLLTIEPYIDAVILREKSKTEQELFNLLQLLKEGIFNFNKIIVHTNPDLAHENGITNVQLPGNSPPLKNLVAGFPNLSFGKSVHSIHEAQQAADEGAQSILYGHLFPTASKPNKAPRGITELEKIVQSVTIPVYAIGGIHPEDIELLRKTNIAGIAIMSPIFNEENPRSVAKRYYNMIHKKGVRMNG